MSNNLVSLLYRLSEKTSAGEIEWEAAEREGVFQAAFPDYSIRISVKESKEFDGAFDYNLTIFNSVGSIVEAVTDDELRKIPDVGIEAGKTIEVLFENARRKAMGVDEAIDKLLGYLGER